MTYETTPKQDQAIREWLQEAIMPLIEQVLVKKLGQAMSFAASEVVQPKKDFVGLTDEEIKRIYETSELAGSYFENATEKAIAVARAIEAAHGIGEKK